MIDANLPPVADVPPGRFVVPCASSLPEAAQSFPTFLPSTM
jgi:hypothetical protein